MRRAAPQLANHRFEHHANGEGRFIYLPPLYLKAALLPHMPPLFSPLLFSTSPTLPAVQGCLRFLRSVCAPSTSTSPRLCGRHKTTPSSTSSSSSSSSVGLLTFQSSFSSHSAVAYFWISRRGAQKKGGCSTFDGKQEVERLLTLKISGNSRCCGLSGQYR
ncbi:hypothetical protein CRENBAI_024913 [Crenichthys baileyi]|uniref:Uncharacterized protein n=1 Tax=Crenichthys baileyi TaxID=28760 RepID=A0AAV9QPI7_9TELE